MSDKTSAGSGVCASCGVVSDGAYCTTCGMELDRRGRVSKIEGSNSDDVLRVYTAVRRSEEERRVLSRSPWLSGSFYLVLFVIVIATLLVVGKVASAWVLPIVVVGGLLSVAVVGALQLRQDEKLSERGFLRLMIAALGKLPGILRHREQPPS